MPRTARRRSLSFVHYGDPSMPELMSQSAPTAAPMEMDKLVSLCKRRGFLFQSSEIYGGLNGFWDYGPLGVELKRNVKEAWWRDMVTGHDDLAAPPGAPRRLRDDRPRLHDHHAPAGLEVLRPLRPVPRLHGRLPRVEEALSPRPGPRPLGRGQGPDASSSPTPAEATKHEPDIEQRALKFFNLRAKDAAELAWHGAARLADHGRPTSRRCSAPTPRRSAR